MSFKDDIKGQSTNLYPIVTIEPPDITAWEDTISESIKLSTNGVSLYHIHKGYNDYVATNPQNQSTFAGIE